MSCLLNGRWLLYTCALVDFNFVRIFFHSLYTCSLPSAFFDSPIQHLVKYQKLLNLIEQLKMSWEINSECRSSTTGSLMSWRSRKFIVFFFFFFSFLHAILKTKDPTLDVCFSAAKYPQKGLNSAPCTQYYYNPRHSESKKKNYTLHPHLTQDIFIFRHFIVPS